MHLLKLTLLLIVFSTALEQENQAMSNIFKPGACRPKAGAHLVSYNCVYLRMSVCVPAPEAINN